MCTSDKTAMPENLDGVEAAPECHRVLHEEGGIRVLEVTVEAGQREPIHTHEYSSVLIGLVKATLRYEVFEWRDGDWATVLSEERVTTPWAARWIESEPPHALTSLDDDVTFKAIRVEFIDPALAALVGRLRLDPGAVGAEVLDQLDLEGRSS